MGFSVASHQKHTCAKRRQYLRQERPGPAPNDANTCAKDGGVLFPTKNLPGGWEVVGREPGGSVAELFEEAFGAFEGRVDGAGDLLQQGVDLLEAVGDAAFEGRRGVFADGGVDFFLVVVRELVVLVHILLDELFELGVGFFPLGGGVVGALGGHLVGQLGVLYCGQLGILFLFLE